MQIQYISKSNLDIPKLSPGRSKSIREKEWRITIRSLRCGKVETVPEVQKSLKDNHGMNAFYEKVSNKMLACAFKAKKKKMKNPLISLLLLVEIIQKMKLS